MWFWSWLQNVYTEESALALITLIALAGLLLSVVIGYAMQTGGVYAALSALVLGGAGIAFVCEPMSATARTVGICVLLILSGFLYLFLSAGLALRAKITERKRRRAEIKRRLQYTLPDRENSFVRARLNTVLRVEEENANADMGGADTFDPPIKLGYAAGLLKKLKDAPLSAAERLQADEMENAFSLYLHKSGWTAGDLRAVNELCSSLLKLSAKYSV